MGEHIKTTLGTTAVVLFLALMSNASAAQTAVKGTSTIRPTIAPTATPIFLEATIQPTTFPTLTPTELTITPQQEVSPTQTPIQLEQVPQPTAEPTMIEAPEVASQAATQTVPVEATAICRDRSYSFSHSRRGTCSHHGGVAMWL